MDEKLREILEGLQEGTICYVDALADIKALIRERLPAEQKSPDYKNQNDVGYVNGFNQCLKEVRE